MPSYRVTIAGKTYTVEIPNPYERPVRAIVDGEVIEVDVEDSDATLGTPPAVTVSAPNPAPHPTPQIAPDPLAASPSQTPAGASGGEVAAPLPGTVVSIDVAEGDVVEHGQELCILEAMKMNNPIRATQAGTVTKIFIYIGQQVQHGEPLMTIS